jgi:8-oxo-dGTP diphosphatase
VEEAEEARSGVVDVERSKPEEIVRAAGGVVWRSPASGDGNEVLLVHRPRYGDWTFPKGKADPGESDEACALREVEEETGLRCELGPELASTGYIDNRGRQKLVRYFAMTPLDGVFTPHAEIDDVRWLGFEEAAAQLSYDRDRDVLRALAVLT